MESQSPDSDASVDESLFALLLDLGIPEAAARRALALTGGHSAEAAAQLYFSSGLDSQDEDEAQGSDVNLLPSRHHKMVFVVNMELSMGTGKHGSHGGLSGTAEGCFQQFLKTMCGYNGSSAQEKTMLSTIFSNNPDHLMNFIRISNKTPTYNLQIAAQVGHAAIGLFQLVHEKPSQRGMINQWDEHGAKKVVLQGVNTDQLLELHALALSLELPTYLVQDAGRTQVPAGSQTVLAIIGEEELVNQVTGQLKLLN